MNLLGELLGSVQDLIAPGGATALRSGSLVQVHNRSVRIGGVIAEGGCATVYHCEDATTGERFALKRMLLDGDQRQVRSLSQQGDPLCNWLVLRGAGFRMDDKDHSHSLTPKLGFDQLVSVAGAQARCDL